MNFQNAPAPTRSAPTPTAPTPTARISTAPTPKAPTRQALALTLGVLLAFLAGPSLWAQEEATETDAAEIEVAEADAAAYEETAHNALRELRAIYEQAVNENRLELLEPHIEEGVVGIMVTGDVVEGLDGLRTYWQALLDLIGEGGSYTTALEPELSWIHGDIAVAKGSTRDLVTLASGKEYQFTSTFTAVLVNHDGHWKIRRMQGTMNPVDNVFIDAKVRSAMLWTGGAAALAGLLLGWFLDRRGARRQAA